VSTDYVNDLSPLANRARGILKWLKRTDSACFSEQRHLDEGSEERVYWHYGYMVALNDALKLLAGEAPLSRGPYTLPQDKNSTSPPVSPDE
jgi:hypothetical protein